MKQAFTTIVFSLLLSAAINAQSPAAVIPQFKFFRPDKTEFTNKDLATGKPLFFVFFDAECEHCRHAVTYINLHYQDYKKSAIYFITLDGREKIELFMNKYGSNLKNRPNLLLLLDLNNEFINKFGPRKYPSLFLYSAKKTLVMYDDDEGNLPKFAAAIKLNSRLL